ncbi:hypothetical protein SAMN04489761_3783 [Tenacibaculum sp. MAR_2009_124]|uniref:hypothetical protein n=1 Tax=Tenacibaculum sp. MAR_2009_124 TaxID=1250059 RepID=UPI00089986D3|nr:hypothetical protein [Tenacibaculum sp. MAR_2009_124]SEC85595.1 hypothetical protein SAMN04489761_3783 [Tenacibaculum sp. MAR_2009_124]
MKINKMFFVIFCIFTLAGYGQKKINNYKYIVVPTRFDFLKKDDQYQTSSLTKFLFKKHGFKVYLENEELPDDLSRNRCLALTGVIKDASSMFTTKNFVELKDCNNRIVFTSDEGASKLKDYKKAYHASIRSAFVSIKNLKYKYVPLTNENVKNDKAIVNSVNSTPEVMEGVKLKANVELKLLYAQSLNNGFQLVDSQPQKVFIVLKSELKNVFILKNKKGIIYKINDFWKAEYYEGEEKITRFYNIKF